MYRNNLYNLLVEKFSIVSESTELKDASLLPSYVSHYFEEKNIEPIKIGDKVSINRVERKSDGTKRAFSQYIGRLEPGSYIDFGGCIIVDNKENVSPEIEQIGLDEDRIYLKFKGKDSVYEIMRLSRDEGSKPQNPLLQAHLKNIEKHITDQPKSIKDMFHNTEIDFSQIFQTVEKIGDKEFIFSGVIENSDYIDSVISLVKEPNSNRYFTRVFRYSGSDNQWKCLPGIRKDGSYMKGYEKNSSHHYVQSAKLHPDVYLALENLSRINVEFDPIEYLPKEGPEGKYMEEFNFKENYIEFEDPKWNYQQRMCRIVFDAYNYYVAGSDRKRDYSLDGHFYKMVTGWSEFLNKRGVEEESNVFERIKTGLEKVNKDPEYSKILKGTTLYSLINSSKNSELKNFVEEYDKSISEWVLRVFGGNRLTESMNPDFSLEKRVNSYTKNLNRKNPIYVEEYEVNSLEGDKLIFAMAKDKEGNVYIDNIYDPRVDITDYGTMGKIAQMGYLVYKPEDYKEQADIGFPKECVGNSRLFQYVNINKLWRKIPLIKRYEKELQKRNIN